MPSRTEYSAAARIAVWIEVEGALARPCVGDVPAGGAGMFPDRWHGPATRAARPELTTDRAADR
jgi:hypothetical protein